MCFVEPVYWIKLKELSQLQVKQLGQFRQSLKAEGSESYQVRELKPLWDQFDSLNNSLLKSLDRLFGGIEDLSKIDSQKEHPDIDNFFKELDNRFTEMSSLLAGNPPGLELQNVKITVNSLKHIDISHFDKAALAIIVNELNNIEAISRKMVNIAMNLADSNLSDHKTMIKEIKIQQKSVSQIPVFDIEYLKGSLFVFFTVVFGFIIWFYVNPPGHSTWYIMGGVFALLFAGAQQVKAIKLIVPFIIAMILASLIYVFILPEITMFYQLGIVLFTCMFVIQYFLPGAAAAVFTIAIYSTYCNQ